MEIKKGWIEVSPEESNLGIIDVGEKHYRRKKAFITLLIYLFRVEIFRQRNFLSLAE